ncbi:putative cysteine protease atg4 [Aspergillus pseudotamarii]|uniref:Cysteine protease n=1 Tax=Aspergillus pseudotamarii TaxID=132259 RepID=A0A5N6SB16_ASPPS|nr:putative cysteine protease atg4 [Aspergillus pseudotamarii]KAE8131147.1 putative cysteine protease atg4 [Aspergillus pseudotamarii]
MNSVDIGRCRKRIVQYLWDPEPKNDEEPDASIWCLGVEYASQLPKPTANKTSERDELDTGTSTIDDVTAYGWPEAFVSDFESKIWMTYRSDFPPIPRPDNDEANHSMTLTVRLRTQLMDPQGFTSDTGWGCMIRSGQSLLANAMLTLCLGRAWRRGDKAEEEAHLLSLFADHPDAPLSIHRFVKHGAESCGKFPGEWFGPSATARCIEALSAQCGNIAPRVYVTNDTSDVYEDSFLRVARNGSGSIQPTLILLGTRLGIDNVTPVYWDGLKAVLQLPQSIGIAGGRPSASHYFIGTQGSHLFYLDPHTTRPALPYSIDGRFLSKEETSTYHTRRLRRIHIQDMDPSMLIGFLVKNEDDWEDWKGRIGSIAGKRIIHVFKGVETTYNQGRREALDEVEVLDDAE